LAIFDADPVPRLCIGRESLSATESLKAEPALPAKPTPTFQAPMCLALHPGSGSDQKNWPEDRWAELLQRLVDMTAFNLLLVGGEAEGERLQRLGAALPPARTRVAQSLPLSELASRLSRCQGFLGHDSGISHLAAALDLPTLVLWGATAEGIWRPPSEKVVVLRHPAGLERLPVQTVFDHVRRIWPAP
jgi:heptosyltransferase-2